MSRLSFLKLSYIQQIKKHVKENKGITYDKLLVKIKVNDPYLSSARGKEYLSDLVFDGQLSIDENGVVKCLR